MSLQTTDIQSEPTILSEDGNFENLKDFKRLKSRDPQFLSQLFADMNPRLIRMLASKGVYKEAAEEIVHECWETFFANIDKFEGRSKITTFLFGILLNKVREDRRRLNRVDYEEDSQKIFDRSFTEAGWWAQEPADPCRLMENRQLGTMIQDCLQGLTESQRAAFLLIELEGETPAEACAILDVSVSHLRVLIFRAKDKLRVCLEGQS